MTQPPEPKPAKVGVVVVNYRSTNLLAGCLDSVLVDEASFVVVVDNGREPACADLVSRLAEDQPGRVEYLDPGANLGYARACNRGARALPDDCDHVVILNPDTRLSVRLSDRVAALAGLPWTILAGGLEGADTVAGNARSLVTLRGELRKAALGSGGYRWPVRPGALQRVGQLDGALLVLRARDWERLGGFDEGFELYYEDVDLCARAEGLEGCWLEAEPWGRHVGGESFSHSSGRAFVALRVSRVRYLRKWFGSTGTLVAAMAIALELLARSATRRPEGARSRWLAARATVLELVRPGSVVVLEGGRR